MSTFIVTKTEQVIYTVRAVDQAAAERGEWDETETREVIRDTVVSVVEDTGPDFAPKP